MRFISQKLKLQRLCANRHYRLANATAQDVAGLLVQGDID